MQAKAQSGGPPMITDDPGVVSFHQWEINTSVNTAVSDNLQLAIPYLDVNYGVLRNLQLKVESPFLITIDQRHWSGEVGEIELGLKTQLLDESKDFISAGIYPQWVVRGATGLLVPLLLEKTFGHFLIGEDIGFFIGKGHQNNLQIGSLIGYKLHNEWELMAEYFFQRDYYSQKGNEGYINFGFRKPISKMFILMGSCGTEINSPAGTQKTYFISWLGLQSHF